MQENPLRRKWKNLGGVQQSCRYRCKHERFVTDFQQITTVKHKVLLHFRVAACSSTTRDSKEQTTKNSLQRIEYFEEDRPTLFRN